MMIMDIPRERDEQILLMLRRETDCMLLRKEQEETQKDFPKDTL